MKFFNSELLNEIDIYERYSLDEFNAAIEELEMNLANHFGLGFRCQRDVRAEDTLKYLLKQREYRVIHDNRICLFELRQGLEEVWTEKYGKEEARIKVYNMWLRMFNQKVDTNKRISSIKEIIENEKCQIQGSVCDGITHS